MTVTNSWIAEFTRCHWENQGGGVWDLGVVLVKRTIKSFPLWPCLLPNLHQCHL